MPLACNVACIASGLQFMARRWPPFINAAACFHADLAHQGRAARRRMIRAAHAHRAAADFCTQALRHRAALLFRFLRTEIHPKARAACAAAEARMRLSRAHVYSASRSIARRCESMLSLLPIVLPASITRQKGVTSCRGAPLSICSIAACALMRRNIAVLTGHVASH